MNLFKNLFSSKTAEPVLDYKKAIVFVTVLYIVVTVSFHKYDISGVFVMVLFPLVGYQVGMIPVHSFDIVR